MKRKLLKANVRWFDRSSGEGLIRVLDDNLASGSVFIAACDIPGKKTWYPHTACVYYTEDQDIEVWYDEEINMYRCHTRGHFDSEKWNSLDQSRLAFVCNDDGQPINGLFANKK